METLLHNSLLAQQPVTQAMRNWDWDTPRTGFGWSMAFLFAIAYLTYVAWMYVKDTQMMNAVWRGWLLLLRLAVLAGVAIIAFNPQLRTQKLAYYPSKAALLIDTSLSMRFPAEDPPLGLPPDSAGGESRIEAARRKIFESDLIETLQQDHEVSVFLFDSNLRGPEFVYPSNSKLALKHAPAASRAGDEKSPEAVSPEWTKLLEPSGTETRLPEAVNGAMAKLGGHLSGVVVVSDGASNAGLAVDSANAAAREQNVRLIAVGVGGFRKPVNLSVPSLQGPEVVRISDDPDDPNDTFDLIALVQGEGLKGKSARVELLLKPKDDPEAEPTPIETEQITFQEDLQRIELKFQREPSIEGREEYAVRVRPTEAVGEVNLDDNEARRTVEVTKRKMQILIVAGGPMRDYRFLRTMLARRAGIEMDIWLQTVDQRVAGAVSQDARELLTSFPQTAEELSKYDTVIAFDPDWTMLAPEQVQFLADWVAVHSGGLIYVAGDVYTGELSALGDAPAEGGPAEFKPLVDMLPVYLTLGGFDVLSAMISDQGWPIEFTADGEQAEFLQLEDDPGLSQLMWKEFPGIYRCYPTAGPKPAATVYALHSDIRFNSQYGQPILFATQFYGSGRVMYIGSGELWRIRSVNVEYFDRLWIKAIREVSQGRMKQGNQRLLLMPERKTWYLGQTVRVRARIYDRQLNPFIAKNVELRVFDPDGKELIPTRSLVADENRPGEFAGDFRVMKQGEYRLQLPDPEAEGDTSYDSTERAEIEVTVPRLESDNTQQNVKLLRELVADTGGKYLTADQANEIPDLLNNVGEEFQVDVSSQPLWDRAWVMYLLIGLLSLEWLTRKLLKLA